ncbi:ferritin-like domain-containing protein [Amycolatopsis taiwanensis]|uniref:DUF4439 domain-containing protein n=1 Tax=Amycolatopsis taiwanensis TaxID=342230 RepID=A0A9W6R6Q4_9PSEU|nr:ferritin-like domain-containing protein [Amycolatopsis taiwanensis]GLY69330.1 hypothetical protein Atai01_59490 [Amycolatopsis taiwanensis]
MSSLTRRDLLRVSALAALAVPLAACNSGFSDEPDPLAPLAEQARADADAARTVPGDLAQQVATVRAAHAQALQAEVERLNRPKSATGPGTPPSGGIAGLKQGLAAARTQAEGLVATLPPYRAGLVAAVAAGCAGLQQVSDELGPGEDPGAAGATAAPVPAGSVDPLQTALDAEHAAVWIYSLVNAFLPNNYTAGVNEGTAEHQDRRAACVRMLAAAGVTPHAAEPAYITPNPVTDATSAKSVVAAAEFDATVAWQGVLNRTDDAELRRVALRAMLGSARRGTRWRQAANLSPTVVALPGIQPS